MSQLTKMFSILALLAFSNPAILCSDSSATGGKDKSQTVYITKTGEKYHADGCRYLKKSKIIQTKQEAKEKGFDPCSVCFKSNISADKNPASTAQKKSKVSDGRCVARTKKGSRCKRVSSASSSTCWQH
ncbi:hypothetical protein [Acanthopleuribacter pedis]|uniref:Uncharacterized protein n=1 Tax=Acanthopleuribacter pedis TaxID=442870 RepID=A0A8J7U4I6_9BACT|nr:hypothetical protein [Acanthopleuribacter pedis]MBO1318336.1 hypothetical protein [Acanthopleuribacter pedis]